MRALGFIALLIAAALMFVAVSLYSTGLFCFEGEVLTGFGSRTAQIPDCSLVRLNNFINPKVWLAGHFAAAVTLSVLAAGIGIGFFRSKRWAYILSIYGIIGLGAFALSLAAVWSKLQ